MRVSSSSSHNALMNALQKNTERLAEMQQKVAEGKNYLKPSDNPEALRKSMAIKVSIQETSRYMNSADAANDPLQQMQVAFTEMSNALTNARTDAVFAGQPSFIQDDFDVLAEKVNESLENMVSLSETKHNGKYIFSGTETKTPPFEFTRDANDEITAITYRGNNEEQEISINSHQKVSVSKDGDQSFTKAFETMIQFRDILQNKAGLPKADQQQAITDFIADIDDAFNDNLRNLTKVGGEIQNLDTVRQQLEGKKLDDEISLSHVENLDLATGAVELSQADNAYQSTLYMISQVSSNGGLLDLIT